MKCEWCGQPERDNTRSDCWRCGAPKEGRVPEEPKVQRGSKPYGPAMQKIIQMQKEDLWDRARFIKEMNEYPDEGFHPDELKELPEAMRVRWGI
ncbi:MAG: hypothetical protein MJA29_14150 [Candidatus Omnitrophica bacterium]|nr:hypothetical protein [Candidatus Omnitrophota bacterium]